MLKKWQIHFFLFQPLSIMSITHIKRIHNTPWRRAYYPCRLHASIIAWGHLPSRMWRRRDSWSTELLAIPRRQNRFFCNILKGIIRLKGTVPRRCIPSTVPMTETQLGRLCCRSITLKWFCLLPYIRYIVWYLLAIVPYSYKRAFIIQSKLIY